MIFCHCAGVSDATIARIIREGASTVADVASRCGAGRSCAPCREEIVALLCSLRGEVENPSTDRGRGGERRVAA